MIFNIHLLCYFYENAKLPVHVIQVSLFIFAYFMYIHYLQWYPINEFHSLILCNFPVSKVISCFFSPWFFYIYSFFFLSFLFHIKNFLCVMIKIKPAIKIKFTNFSFYKNLFLWVLWLHLYSGIYFHYYCYAYKILLYNNAICNGNVWYIIFH